MAESHISPRAMPRRLNVSRGNALILVHTSRYELGAPCPKFSGLLVVPATFFPFSMYESINKEKNQ